MYIVGWYDVPEGLVCSFPVTINPKGSWSVVQDINQTNEVKEKIKEAVKVIITYTHCIKKVLKKNLSNNRYYRNIFFNCSWGIKVC